MPVIESFKSVSTVYDNILLHANFLTSAVLILTISIRVRKIHVICCFPKDITGNCYCKGKENVHYICLHNNGASKITRTVEFGNEHGVA